MWVLERLSKSIFGAGSNLTPWVLDLHTGLFSVALSLARGFRRPSLPLLTSPSIMKISCLEWTVVHNTLYMEEGLGLLKANTTSEGREIIACCVMYIYVRDQFSRICVLQSRAHKHPRTPRLAPPPPQPCTLPPAQHTYTTSEHLNACAHRALTRPLFRTPPQRPRCREATPWSAN